MSEDGPVETYATGWSVIVNPADIGLEITFTCGDGEGTITMDRVQGQALARAIQRIVER